MGTKLLAYLPSCRCGCNRSYRGGAVLPRLPFEKAGLGGFRVGRSSTLHLAVFSALVDPVRSAASELDGRHSRRVSLCDGAISARTADGRHPRAFSLQCTFSGIRDRDQQLGTMELAPRPFRSPT